MANLVEGKTGVAPDGTKVIVRGGRVVPLDGAPSVGGLKAAPPEWGAGAQVLPNGKVVRQGPRGGMIELGDLPGAAGAVPDIKEFQASAAARSTLMDQGLTDYDAARRDGYDPASGKNRIARALEGSGPGNFVADWLRDNPSERGRAAELQFTDGALRTTSGANAPEPEVVRANKSYFRQPGESAGVEPNKAELRQRFRDQSVRIAGPAYSGPTKKAPADQARASDADRSKFRQLQQAGQLDRARPVGERVNPYVADAQTAERLPKGSWVVVGGRLGQVQ